MALEAVDSPDRGRRKGKFLSEIRTSDIFRSSASLRLLLARRPARVNPGRLRCLLDRLSTTSHLNVRAVIYKRPVGANASSWRYWNTDSQKLPLWAASPIQLCRVSLL